MNCKPGDLAIILPPSNNAGKVVEVIREARGGHSTGLYSWFCQSMGGDISAYAGKKMVFTRQAQIPDAWLKPVSGLPIDDEVPTEVKEPA